MTRRTVQLDLRAVLPIAGLAIVIFVIIFLELCGRSDTDLPTVVAGPTATLGPTFTPGPSPTVGPTPTLSPDEATAMFVAASGDEGRDATRQQDFAALQAALEQYRDEHGEYPNSDGNIQTLCAFTEADVGCALQEVLDPLPVGPLGDPARAYWYASTGDTYTIYAQRESDALPECEEHPDHLEVLDSVMCIRGP
jgi:hypothetical protein